MGGKFEKSHGAPPGPRDGAEAGERSETTNGGWSVDPEPGGAPPCDFSNFPPIVKTKSRYSAKKFEILRQIHATQAKVTSLCV